MGPTWRERRKYDLQTRIGAIPRWFFPIVERRRARRRDPHWLRPELTGPETDLVLEGFPRSGNTFAVVAFQLSQPSMLRVAHHHHAPAQVLRGLELGVPCLVLVRPPRDAVTSFLIRRPELTPALALRGYVRFHAPLVGVADRIVFADFAEVTRDFGAVTGRLNQRADRHFARFHHDQANVERCFQTIEARNREQSGGQAVSEAGVARPSSRRDDRRRDLHAALEHASLRPLVREAEALYQRLSAETGRP